MPGYTSHGSFPDGMATTADKLVNLEQIGCGGFGEVFKATHVDWGVVAYKRLPQQFIKENKAVKQMAREVEILRGLRHKNIISISGIVFERGNYGILLEYMKYGGLDNFLAEFTVPLFYKVQLAWDVVLGMNYLHTLDKPIIHGDLKIQNVLVAEGYQAVISDFGLSSWKDMSKTSSRSNGVPQGTVTHVPPERWLNVNLARNPMEDVYAYGILLWEMFTEQMPFANASVGMISAVVQNGQRPDLALLPQDVPRLIHSLMETSWHRDQSERKPFKEIKETLDRYMSEKGKETSASKEEIQRQELSSSQTSLEFDGSLNAQSLSRPLSLQRRTSVETNHQLPVIRNETGDRGATDFTNIRMDLNPETQSDKEIAAGSSLCTGDPGNAKEDATSAEVEWRRGGGGDGRTVAAEASLCKAEDVNELSHQLNIRPVQDFDGRSVRSEPFLSSNVVELRSNCTNDDLPSETDVKNTTQPKTVDDLLPSHLPNAAAAAAVVSSSGKEDAGMRLSLHSDPPSECFGDANLRSNSVSLGSSYSMSDGYPSIERGPRVELISNRRLIHSQSVPEADAILSPDVQRDAIPLQPSFCSKENDQRCRAVGEEEKRSSTWNAGEGGTDNLDVSRGYYPKGGGSFQKHVHPDVHQPPAPSPQSQNAQHLFQPTVPSRSQWKILPTGPGGFAVNQSGGYNIPPLANQPLTKSLQGPALNRCMEEEGGVTWSLLQKNSKPLKGTKPMLQESSTIIVKDDDKEVTVIDNAGSGIQIGNNNTMIIGGRASQARRKTDSRQPPAPSSSSSSLLSSVAAANVAGNAVNAPKATVTKKIIVPDKLVVQDSIVMVARKISKDWKPLARQLGFHESDIDGFDIDFHQLGVEEVAYQMLRDWRERKGQEAKMQALASALVAVKRADIALNLSVESTSNSRT